ncbi:hypothetical protein KAJ27_13825, partial [bacterium]|nr:hypothetical protein [bacterium]
MNKTFRNNTLGIILAILIFAGFIGAFQLGRNSVRSSNQKFIANKDKKTKDSKKNTKAVIPELLKQENV